MSGDLTPLFDLKDIREAVCETQKFVTGYSLG
jgi:hypothetical protein